MNERQAYALAHPLTDTTTPQAVADLRTIHHVGQGELLVIILAVDR